jgi:hypothetical protein
MRSAPTDFEIEMVAQAIRTQFGARSDRPKPLDWDKLPELLRCEYRAEAKAAINAYLSAAN